MQTKSSNPTNTADVPLARKFLSPSEMFDVQQWAKANIWKDKYVFGDTPQCPKCRRESSKGFWLLVTHFGKPGSELLPMVDAINERLAVNGIYVGIHGRVLGLLGTIIWHKDKPRVLAATEVTEEWIWISFPEATISVEEIIPKLGIYYPGGDELLSAILMSSNNIFPQLQSNIFMLGYSVKAHIDGLGKQECCLMITPHKGKRKFSHRIELHPISSLKPGCFVACSQY